MNADEYRSQRQAMANATEAPSLSHLRIVSKDQTRVWRTHTRNSSFGTRLKRGQVVTFLEKRGRLVRVGFGDRERGACEVGWVHSKYLQRIKEP